MTEPKFSVAITADDKTAAGAKSAEKRLATIPKHAGIATRRVANDGEKVLRGRTGSILRTFSQVERAGARVFGGSSITAGVAGRLGSIGEAASAAGTGLGEAAAAGGILSASVTAVGVVVGATVGILAAGAYAAFKFADGWARGAASIARTSEVIGVGAKTMQEFSAAAERLGIDRGAATGAVGSLSQTLNDARYGRNNQALTVLSRLGVAMKTKEDGTADVDTMLPTIASAIARQNSSGRRTAAKALGIPIDVLPAFSQGGEALRADMRDADANAAVLDDGQLATGTRIARKGAIVGQMKDRVVSNTGAETAADLEGGYDIAIDTGRGGIARGVSGAISGFTTSVEQKFKPAAEKIAQGGRAIERAAGVLMGKLNIHGIVVPGQSKITSGFGHRDAPSTAQGRGTSDHKGVDLRYAFGTKVGSVAAGKVAAAGAMHGYGNAVFVDYGNGYVGRYGHLSKVDVAVGDKVEAGQQLGLSGNTGRSTGPHLHYEVRRDGVPIDPVTSGFFASSGLGRNPGNMRPKGRFAEYDTAGSGILAIARQVVIDERRGQNTTEKLIGGVPGKNGRLAGGYAPASDGNDVGRYVKTMSQRGVGPQEYLDPDNIRQLATIVAAIVQQESGNKLNTDQVQRIILEVHGLPAKTKVLARSTRGAVAVSHAMPN